MGGWKRFLGLLAAGALVGACGGDDDDPVVHTGQMAFEVEHYDFVLDLATDVATVEARLRVTTAGDCLRIGFRPASASGIFLGEVEGTNLAIDGTALSACDGRGLGFAAGEVTALRVTAPVPRATLGPSDVGLTSKTDRAGGMFTYLVSWVGGCDRHGPCDARPDRFATYRFTVQHAEGTQVLCSGTVTAGPTSTTCDFALPGGPTYSTFALMARTPAWSQHDLGVWDGVTATLHDVPGSMIAETIDEAGLAGGFGWMIDTFGAYPYGDELRFVIGPTYWSGFEHPGNIALDEYLVGPSYYADPLMHVALHEIVHQWAGDQATLADTYDFVWKEAMAEYLAFVIEDELLDPAAALQTAKAWKIFSDGAAYFPVPGERPELFEYYGDVYGPGPMVLFRQLEALYSREAVIAAVQALIGTGMPRALSVEDVRAALEAQVGESLEAYFDAWVYGTGAPPWPEVTMSLTDNMDGTYTVNVAAATGDNVARGCAFHVRLVGAGGETMDVNVSNGAAGGAYPPVTVTPGFAPVSLELDPFAEALVYEAPGSKPRINPWLGGDGVREFGY